MLMLSRKERKPKEKQNIGGLKLFRGLTFVWNTLSQIWTYIDIEEH